MKPKKTSKKVTKTTAGKTTKAKWGLRKDGKPKKKPGPRAKKVAP